MVDGSVINAGSLVKANSASYGGNESIVDDIKGVSKLDNVHIKIKAYRSNHGAIASIRRESVAA